MVKDSKAEDIFIREEFGEEQMMMLRATEVPLDLKSNLIYDAFEEKDYELVENLMRKAGQLGLLAISVPENIKVSEWDLYLNADKEISFISIISYCFWSYTGIGTLPILLYGNEEQNALLT